jgi:hypothetical protein
MKKRKKTTNTIKELLKNFKKTLIEIIERESE